ncbi:MAG: efflux RND transporter periplasmic adaptor subunit [Chthoniobacterales bacterium]|jgi:membrane fusion protein, multidrug efflux system|nr:efflux RND transporter periplasmic adaptor subunit [Chthoniobacterales bacterium]
MSHSKYFTSAILAVALASSQTLAAADADAAPAGPLKVEGLVTPEREVDLAAPSEGLVVEIKTPEGTSVKEGEMIARLSDDEESILLRNAELQAKKLQEDFASMERLYKEKAASRDDYTKAMLAAQQGAAERDLYAIRLQKRSIVAPCDASILRILKDPGESVQRMEKFAELVSVDKLYVTAYVDAHFLGKIPVGTAARVLLPGGKGAVSGKVTVSDPVLDAGGAVFRVRVLVEEPGDRIQPGTRVQLELSLPGQDSA